MLTENLRVQKNITWLDVLESSYERFLLTSYENYIANCSKYHSISIAEAKAKIAQPEIRKGPRDIWRFIYLDETEVGYIWFYLKKDGKSAFLMDIHFYPEFRGKGLGSHLMAMLRDHLLSMSVESLELNVFKQNIPAVRLYEKLGFKEAGNDGASVKMSWLLKTARC